MALPLLTFVVCLFAFRLHEDKATFAITKANAPFKLVVDAGHGGTDNGAAANGLLEKNINLSISKKIKELSGEYGINVVLTRDNDASATPPERVDWIKQQHADACVSIHVNATEASVTDSSGMELVVAKNNDNGYLQQSQLMGSAIWGQLSESFKVAPTLKQNNVGIWVLQANTVPAVLIECGYINNPGDAKKLTDAASIEKLARKILEGVAMYANKKGTTGDNKYYQGKKYKSVNIDAAAELVTMHFEDGSTKTISLHEAVKENIVQKTINLSGEDTTAPKPAPLYVIDGKISDKVQMEKIDPKDIKSVNVLKGESATTAYGDKGKNGVVEITTKNAVARPMNDSLLYVLDGKTVMAAEVNNLDPAKIISVNVLKDKDAVSKYGSKAKYGAVEITSVNKNDNTIDTVLPKTEPK